MKRLLSLSCLTALFGTLGLSQAQSAQDAGAHRANPANVSLVPRGVVELEPPGLADPYVPPVASDPLEAGIAKAPMREMRSRLHYSQEADGEWVRGRTFKARASKDGFTYIPFLGSHAPRNFPVEFRLASAELEGRELALDPVAAVTRTGDRFVLDRGPVEVIYDVELDQVEQSFAVDAAGADGDLVLRLDVQTELARHGDGAGFRFDGSLGSVRYGEATVLDGTGRQAAVPGRLEGDQLILRVPASFLRESQGLVVVDPVISTFAVDTYIGAQWRVDVAYDYSNDVYCYAYEEVFSESDGDVFQMAISSGGLEHFGYIDMGAMYWKKPKIANNNRSNKFLVVAKVGREYAGNTIRGRLVDASTGQMTPQFVIQHAEFIGSEPASITGFPDVAGQQGTGFSARNFCVVYPHNSAGAGYSNIRRVMVSDTGWVFASADIEQTNWWDHQVAISQSAGDPATVNRFNIVYLRSHYWNVKETVRTVQLNHNGSIVSGPRDIEVLLGNINSAVEVSVSDGLSIDGSAPTYLVGRTLASDSYPAALSICRGSVLQRRTETHELLHHEDAVQRSIRSMALATIPRGFLLSYEMPYPDANLTVGIYSAALNVTSNDRLAVSEAPSRLGTTGWTVVGTAVASAEGGGHPYSLDARPAWSETQSLDIDLSAPYIHDVYSAFYRAPTETAVGEQFCKSDFNSTGERGFITILGDSSTTGLKQMVASNLPTGNTGYFFVGTSYTTSIQANGGVLCVGSRIGQYYAQIIGADGTASRSLNPSAVPYWFSSTSALVGDVWNVQFWHRDNDAGFQRSNYTNAATLRF